MPAALTLYGIPNCDQVRRARAWLDQRRTPYRFHDFKRDGLPPALASAWLAALGAEALINRKGTTWRRLSDAERASADAPAGALALLTAQPSLVRRPVLAARGRICAGYDERAFEELIGDV
ncbi:MAG: arsenate reductase [Burkholderiales bacterium]|nr:arsenate reductase [Burkholderiales bacterium]